MPIPVSMQQTLARVAQLQATLSRFAPPRSEATVSSVGASSSVLSPSVGEAGSFEAVLNQAQQLSPAERSLAGRDQIKQWINAMGQKHGVDAKLLESVVATESGFNTEAISQSGAQGLMQLMPQTAHSLGVEDALDPVQNLDGGTRYLKGLLNKYQSVPKALAAYNAGPGAVDRSGGIPPYAETQQYVKKVMAQYQGS